MCLKINYEFEAKMGHLEYEAKAIFMKNMSTGPCILFLIVDTRPWQLYSLSDSTFYDEYLKNGTSVSNHGLFNHDKFWWRRR